MSEIRKWLETIGLAQYADAFEANEIEMDLLRQVDDQMLKDIGVSIGGRSSTAHSESIWQAVALNGFPVTRPMTVTQDSRRSETPRYNLMRNFAI